MFDFHAQYSKFSLLVSGGIFTARKRSCRKVMFSKVSVILFRRGPQMTIAHDALGHGYLPLPHTLSLLLTSGGHHLRPVQPCSLEDLLPIIYWHLVVATETGSTHATGMLSSSKWFVLSKAFGEYYWRLPNICRVCTGHLWALLCVTIPWSNPLDLLKMSKLLEKL